MFDLETNADRACPADHEIIEIGACRVVDGAVHGEFSTLARAERTLLPEIEQLTGITAPDLERASPLADGVVAFLEFVGDMPLVAPMASATTSSSSTRPAGASVWRPRPAYGWTALSSRVVYPRAGTLLTENEDGRRPPKGRSLNQFADHLGLDSGGRHRALADARLTAGLVRELLKALDTTAPDRELQRWILHAGGHPWGAVHEEARRPAHAPRCRPGSRSVATARR